MADIATKRIFENDKITVWEMVLEPGESTGVHTHLHDFVVYVLEGSTGEATDKDGNVLGRLELASGDTMAFTLDGDEIVQGEIRFPATHGARNVGETRYREILIETK